MANRVTRPHAEPLTLLAAAIALLVLSGIGPRDRFTWFLALVGAVAAQLTLGRLHERHLARLAPDKGVDGSPGSA